MGEVITYVEIYRRFPNEWILLGDPKTDESSGEKSGILLFHDPERDAVYKKAIELKPKRFAFLCTVEQPADMVLVL